MLSRKEIFAHADVWSLHHGFQKSDGNEWEDIFTPLLEKGFTFEEACEIIDSIVSLTKKEFT